MDWTTPKWMAATLLVRQTAAKTFLFNDFNSIFSWDPFNVQTDEINPFGEDLKKCSGENSFHRWENTKKHPRSNIHLVCKYHQQVIQSAHSDHFWKIKLKGKLILFLPKGQNNHSVFIEISIQKLNKPEEFEVSHLYENHFHLPLSIFPNISKDSTTKYCWWTCPTATIQS